MSLFRVWFNYENRMSYEESIDHNGNVIAFEYGNAVGTHRSENAIVMFNTGFKDRNDKSIYFGDRVKIDNEIYNVESNPFNHAIVIDSELGQDRLVKFIHRCEVVGNIYEE